MPLADILFGTAPIRWIQQAFGTGHPLPFRVLSLAGDTWGIILVAGIALWLFGPRAFREVVAFTVIGAAVRFGLAALFDTPRPAGPGIEVYTDLEIGAFPSGHVFAALGPWGLLCAMGYVPVIVPILVTVLVGLGRLYLAAHFLADIVGAAVFTIVLIAAYRRARAWRRARLVRAGGRTRWLLSLAAGTGALASTALVEPDARHFEISGMVLGAAIAIPAGRRWRRRPEQGGADRRARALAGTAGVVFLLLCDRLLLTTVPWSGMLTAGLAAIWAIHTVPWIFGRSAAGTL